MNPITVAFHVDKDPKTSNKARGKKKNDTNSTIIPGNSSHCFEVEEGGDDYLELWVETTIPHNVFIKVDTDEKIGPDPVRVKIRKVGNSWKLRPFLEQTQAGRPQGVNVTIGEDKTDW